MKREKTGWEIFVDIPDVEILFLCCCSRHHVQFSTKNVGYMCDKKQCNISIPCQYNYVVKAVVDTMKYQTCIFFLVGCLYLLPRGLHLEQTDRRPYLMTGLSFHLQIPSGYNNFVWGCINNGVFCLVVWQ